MNGLDKYGAENLGMLKKVMLHCPKTSIWRVNERSMQFYLFDRVPHYDKYLEEHTSYRNLLISSGVEVYELSDLIINNLELVSYLPNLAYLNDVAVITQKGAVISSMCPGGRQYEQLAAAEALTALRIPLLYTAEPCEQFEGFITLSDKAIFVAETERFSKASIERFFTFALGHFEEIIYAQVPKERRFMHPDMVFNRISDRLGVYFPPAFLKCWRVRKDKREQIDFSTFMNKRGVELIPVSDEEQQKWATSFVPLKPGHIICYDISFNASTKSLLASKGVEFTEFHPDALLAGGGSLRCLTMRLLRE